MKNIVLAVLMLGIALIGYSQTTHTSVKTSTKTVGNQTFVTTTTTVTTTDANGKTTTKTTSKTETYKKGQYPVLNNKSNNQYKKQNSDNQIANTQSEVSTDDYVSSVFSKVNVERRKSGLKSYLLDDQLCRAAQIRANELDKCFSHNRPDGRDCYSVLNELRISYNNSGENIAQGQDAPTQVMDAWMHSSGHRANILSKKFSRIGIGYSSATNSWVQLFAN